MHGGHYIAYNIHQSVLKQVVDHQPKFQELQEIPPMIGLAVGKNAVAYGPDVGVVTGPEVMEAYFRNDLGWASKLSARLLFFNLSCYFNLLMNGAIVCWDYMQLGNQRPDVKTLETKSS